MVKIGIVIDSSSNIGHIISLYKLIAENEGLQSYIIVEKKNEILLSLLSASISELNKLILNSFSSDQQQLYLNQITTILECRTVITQPICFDNLTVYTVKNINNSFTFHTEDQTYNGLTPDLLRIFLTQDSSINVYIDNENTFIFKNSKVGEMMAIPKPITNPRLKSHININVYCSWDSSPSIAKGILQYCRDPSENNDKIDCWKFQTRTLQITSGLRHPDYNYVMNSTNEHLSLNTIYTCVEPPGCSHFENCYTNSKKANITYFGSHKYHSNFVGWHLGMNINQLIKTLEKGFEKQHDKILSIVVSDKYNDPGHKARIDFIREMDNRSKQMLLPFGLHIYGRCSSLGFHNYKGELPSCQKDDGLIPYKYHFNAENFSVSNYVSEKFTDAVMAECLIFYWGCPNLEQIYDRRSFIRLSLNKQDIEQDIEKIFLAMVDNEYEERLQYIREVKRDMLFNRSLFPKLNNIITLSETCMFAVNQEDFGEKEVNLIRDSCFKYVQSIKMISKDVNSYLDVYRHMLSTDKDCIVVQNPNVRYQDIYDRLSNVCLDTHDIVFLGVDNMLEGNYWIKLSVLEELFVCLLNCHQNRMFEQLTYTGMTFEGMIKGLIKKFRTRTIKM